MEYLNYPQVTHDCAYTTLYIHASAICSIFKPTEQARASAIPVVKQLLKGVFRKGHHPECGQHLGSEEVLRPTAWLGKPSALNYTWLTLKTVMISTLVTVKRPSDLNLLKITPRTMQITEDSVTFSHQCLGLKRPGQTIHMVLL